MKNIKKTQLDYTAFGAAYQLRLPLDIEIMIPKNDPVRLIDAVISCLDLSCLTYTFERLGRSHYPPATLLKIMVYAYSRRIYSSRQIEKACRENINFMFLLQDCPPPDHNTIARFRRDHLSQVSDTVTTKLTELLADLGEVSFEKSAVFIDGTKIEANANKYTFVWKKGVLKNRDRLLERIRTELPDLLKTIGINWRVPDLIRVKDLRRLKKKVSLKLRDEGIEIVRGKGKRKTQHQRVLETVDGFLSRFKQYTHDLHVCGERNSYSKTDHDATFMRMKEDHMLNGQLKPGYNVNVATVNEYVIGSYISSDRTDTRTFIPFTEKLLGCGYDIRRMVLDSGYESEENYRYVQDHEDISLFVKPANHEQKKKRKYKSDISRRENMAYDSENDAYTCANGKKLYPVYEKKTKSDSGYPIQTTVYECRECSGCPLKEKCIRSRSSTPLSERVKRLNVSKYFQDQRTKMEEKIESEEGKLLRVNRSIQAEGVFAFVKEDLLFRRFMMRGTANVATEWMLLSFAYNMLKLHNKIQKERLGEHLKRPKAV